MSHSKMPDAGRGGLLDQVMRFTLIGAAAALIDFGSYHAILGLDVHTGLARGSSFTIGTSISYVLNRRWTFAAPSSRRTIGCYFALYGTTFGLIIGLNSFCLWYLPAGVWAPSTAWAISQAFGSLWNFAALRLFVLHRRPRKVGA